MVSGKDVERKPGITHHGQLSEQPGKPLRYNLMVLKPEVKQIAHQEQSLGILLNCGQPVDQALLPPAAFYSRWCTKVEVGCKVDPGFR